MDVVRRPKDAFLMGSEFSSTNLDRAGHFGPVHGSNRRRSGKQLITLDLNHFGFRGRGVTGHWSAVKAGIDSKRRRRRWCGRGCRRSGWRRHWGARRHANRAWAIWRRSTTTFGIQYTDTGTRSGGVWKASQGLLGALHSTALRGGGIKCLVIFRLLAAKEGFELLDCEFATKVSH